MSEALRTEDVGRRFFVAFRDSLERMADSLAGPSREADRRAPRADPAYPGALSVLRPGQGMARRPRRLPAPGGGSMPLARRRRLHRDLFRPLFFGTLNRRPRRTQPGPGAFGRIRSSTVGCSNPTRWSGRGGPISPTPRGATPLTTSSSASISPCTRAPTRDASPPTCWDGCSRASWLRPTGGRAARSIRPRGWCDGWSRPRSRRCWLSDWADSTEAARAGSARRTRHAPRCSGNHHARPRGGLRGVSARRAGAHGAIRAGEELPPRRCAAGSSSANLFGVDLNPMAVRLAELRLWLAVIAVDGTTDPEAVAAAPQPRRHGPPGRQPARPRVASSGN